MKTSSFQIAIGLQEKGRGGFHIRLKLYLILGGVGIGVA